MHPGYARGDVDFPGASFDAWLTTEPADDYEPFCGKCWDTGCSLCTDPEDDYPLQGCPKPPPIPLQPTHESSPARTGEGSAQGGGHSLKSLRASEVAAPDFERGPR